jgi:(S)-sulfolactate dehydrogenase
MADIVISEFMDEAAIAEKLNGRDALYDAKLVDDPARLYAALKDARAIVVRNRTQVRGALLDAAPKLTISTWTPARLAGSRSFRRPARMISRSPNM